ncbi:MAG: SulP family inorganic anion transporter [Vampirovibrionales bacterium]|nr:SulP family inorganic anion transporter [Vampirovibrionales bacterium]
MTSALTRYLKTDLPGDLTGGLTTAIVALPIALAFGVASGLGPAAGLYGAIAAGILAALLGGTPGQASGPTGPMTVIVASIAAAHTQDPVFVFAAILLAGVFQIIFGLIRAGRYIHYIPYPVVSGFMTGIGVIIILLQLPPLLGLPAPSSPIAALGELPHMLTRINPTAAALGLGVMAAIYLLPRLYRHLPASLIALVAATVLASALGLAVPLLGAIPAGLPEVRFPAFSLGSLELLLPAALSLAVLSSIDSLLTAVVVDRLTGRHHDSDRELIGQGIGNMGSALIGGLPCSGATMRSVVNIRSGGRTRFSGVFHGIVLLAVLLGLGPLASQIPYSALAGVLVTVGLSIIDTKGLKSIGKASKSDVATMLTVAALTVFVDLIVAVLAGLALAGILFSKKLGDRARASEGYVSSLAHLDALIEQFPAHLRESVYFYTLNAPLYFATVRQFKATMSALPQIHALILDFRHAPLIDQSGGYALEETLAMLADKGVRTAVVGMSPRIRGELAALGALAHLPQAAEFDAYEPALRYLLSQEPAGQKSAAADASPPA